MDLVAIDLHALFQVENFAIDPHFGVTLFAHVVEEFAVVPLTAPDERRKELYFFALKALINFVEHLLLVVFDHRFAGHVAVGHGGAGEEEPQEIVDLGDGADRGAGVFARRLLLDGNDRTQPGDLLYFGPLHLSDELPGVGAEGFHVAALPLGVNGVEGEGGFAATRNARDDHELVARNGDVHIAEVVLVGPDDVDVIGFGDGGSFGGLRGCGSSTGFAHIVVGNR